MQYPAPGSLELARRVVELVGSSKVSIRDDWGLDHGTWSVLHHLRPEADIPVVQLSLDASASAEEHVAIGRALAPLRDEGVLIMGSGNITHNLRYAMMSSARDDHSTPPWAERFDADVASAVEQHDTAALARILESENGRLSHPTPDHYLPLLYTAGAAGAGEPVRYPVTGFDLGSLSMRAILIG